MAAFISAVIAAFSIAAFSITAFYRCKHCRTHHALCRQIGIAAVIAISLFLSSLPHSSSLHFATGRSTIIAAFIEQIVAEYIGCRT